MYTALITLELFASKFALDIALSSINYNFTMINESFFQMEKIQRVGVWPVGLVGGLMVEKPVCDNATNKVIGFNSAWKPNRPFPLDMAGFAINLKLLLQHDEAWFSYDVQGGYQESEILRQIVTRDELEPLADCCMKVSTELFSRRSFDARSNRSCNLNFAGVRVAHANGTATTEGRTNAN